MQDINKEYKDKAIAMCEALGLDPFEKVQLPSNNLASVFGPQWRLYTKRLYEFERMLKIIGGN